MKVLMLIPDRVNHTQHPMMYSPKAQSFVPISEKQFSIAIWNRIAPFYSKEWMPVLHPFHNTIAKQCLKEVEGMDFPSILDVASGAGEPAISIAKINPNTEILSTDVAAVNIRFGQFRSRAGNLFIES
jgi:ubiquinone/menaquinone biosynthesis C-methylase UbiE